MRVLPVSGSSQASVCFIQFCVVALREILARMGAAAFLAVDRAFDRDDRLLDQIVELQRLDQIGVPDHASGP